MARNFTGQVRMGDRSLRLWMGFLKFEAERGRNRRPLRTAQEAKRHLHADLPDAT